MSVTTNQSTNEPIESSSDPTLLKIADGEKSLAFFSDIEELLSKGSYSTAQFQKAIETIYKTQQLKMAIANDLQLLKASLVKEAVQG